MSPNASICHFIVTDESKDILGSKKKKKKKSALGSEDSCASFCRKRAYVLD